MNVLPIKNNYENDIKQLHLLFKLRMDGDISQQLRENGMVYTKNYGVNILTIKKEAEKIEVPSQLIDFLWFSNIREFMLLAIFKADEKSFDTSKLEKWAEQITNIELAEQIAFHLFYKIEIPTSTFSKWINSNKNLINTALLTATRKLKINQSLSEETIQLFIDFIANNEQNLTTAQLSARFLSSLIRNKKETLDKIKRLISNLDTNFKPNQIIIDEVNAEIDYLFPAESQ